MIDDQEMLELFSAESEEHLQQIEEGLLKLELEPADGGVLADMLREVHSLKGAARMLGLADIEGVAHRMEDLLGEAVKDSPFLSQHSLALLYQGHAALQCLVQEALTGEKSPVNTAQVLAMLLSGMGDQISVADLLPENPAGDEFQGEAAHPVEGAEGENKEHKSETIRVATAKLDELMAQTGELNVTGLRSAQRLADMEEIATSWKVVAGKILVGNKEFLGVGLKERGASGPDSDNIAVETVINDFGRRLADFQHALQEDSSRLRAIADEFSDRLANMRLLPLTHLFNPFRKMVREFAAEQGKQVQFVVRGRETAVDKLIIEELKDPLMHVIRNAIHHGIEMPDERRRLNKPPTGAISINAYRQMQQVVVDIRDDGRGLDEDALKKAALMKKLYTENELNFFSQAQVASLMFISGVSTSPFVSDIAGRGVGLDVVRTNVERLKGTLRVETSPGRGLLISIRLPLTLGRLQVMLVTCGNAAFAIPLDNIEKTCRIAPRDVFSVEGRRTIVIGGIPIYVADLLNLLEMYREDDHNYDAKSGKINCIIIRYGEERAGILVDDILDTQEIVLKSHNSLLKRIRNVSGATILGTGEVCPVLNPGDIIKSLQKLKTSRPAKENEKLPAARKKILVAEDSITVRTQMKRILEGAGYDVTATVDGLDAYAKLAGDAFDAVVTDIMMPNMDGLTLTEKIRQEKRHREMPVILVTSLASDDDRKRGIEVGANAYITKPSFDQKVLLDTLRRFI